MWIGFDRIDSGVSLVPLLFHLNLIINPCFRSFFLFSLALFLLRLVNMYLGKQENLGVADKVCLANYPLASLFSSAKVEFRNQAVNDFNSQFAYVGFLRALTDFDKDGRESLLGSTELILP